MLFSRIMFVFVLMYSSHSLGHKKALELESLVLCHQKVETNSQWNIFEQIFNAWNFTSSHISVQDYYVLFLKWDPQSYWDW
jgi:hypothetical protein